ncbi:MAG TPA: acyltransferase [Baekduia sp.]|nr:acyltransferase [Baekduia sp.]
MSIDARADERADSGTGPRLEFLDALRGLAALSVAAGHRAEGVVGGFVHFDAHVFRFGLFGVVLFFLCSGFIIPASLERHGSLRRFWISRFFRLYPLYWVAMAGALALHMAGSYALGPVYEADVLGHTLVNLTMLQAFLSQPLLLGLSWTLAFELGFYLLVSGLFLAGAHRRAVPLAATVLALTVALALHSDDQPKPLVGVALLVTAGLGLTVARGAGPRQVLGLCAVAALSVPLLFNPFYAPWFSVALFSALFTGTVVYRWAHAELAPRRAAALFAGAAVAVGVSAALAADRVSVAPTLVAAYAVFGGAFALRHRTFPAWALRLGVISYSVYLLHPLVFAVLGNAEGSGTVVRVIAYVGALVLSVGLAELSYRAVERPMIVRGRRAAARATRTPVPEVAAVG